MSFSSFSRLYYTLFLSAFCALPAAASSGVTGINNHPAFKTRDQENLKTTDACRHRLFDSDNLRQAISRFELIADHVRMTATQHAHHKNQVDPEDLKNQTETKDKHHPRDKRPTDETIAGHANKVLIEELHHLMDPKNNKRNLRNNESDEEKIIRQGNRVDLILTRREAIRLMHCGEQMISSVLRDIHSQTIHHTSHHLENQLEDFLKTTRDAADLENKDDDTDDTNKKRQEIETALKDIIAKVDTKGGVAQLIKEKNRYSDTIKGMIAQGQSPHVIKDELGKLLKEIEDFNKKRTPNPNSVPPEKPGH